MPRRRRSTSAWVTSLPSMKIRPWVGSTRRLIIRRVVVFPHPEGPTRTTNSPRLISIESSETAAFSWRGYRLETPSRKIMASGLGVGLSDIQSSQSGDLGNHDEQQVEDQSNEHHSDHSREGFLQR